MLSLAFRNLFRNIRRTVAILLTVALGAGALFSFDGFINGVLTQYRDDTIHANYGFGQIHTKGYRESVFAEPWKHWIKNPGALEKFLFNLEGVEKIFPRVSFSALLTNGNVSVSGHGQGIDAKEEANFFYALNASEGKTLYDEANGILLGYGLAKALNVRPGDPVTVKTTSTDGEINHTNLRVVGIFQTGLVEFDNHMFRIQLNEAKKLLKTGNIELYSLGLKNLSDWKNVAKKVEAAFPELEAIPFDVLDKVYYQHSVDWLNAQFHVVQFIIMAILLLGIFNSVSACILERKQEIGNLRANGESVFSIMKLIVTEGGLLGIFGGLFGMGLSYLVLKVFLDKGILMPPGPGHTLQFVAVFNFQWSMVFLTLALSSIAAIIASIFAGWRVARMPIAKALRSH